MPTVKQANPPQTFAALSNDPALLTAFAHFANASSNKEHIACLRYCTGHYKVPQRYSEFHSPIAPYKIKIAAGLQQQLDTLAKSKRRENQSEMKKIHKTIQKSCEAVLNRKSLPAFYKSEYFADIHLAKLVSKAGKAYGKGRDTWVTIVAKLFNLKSPKSIKMVEAIADEIETGSASSVKAACDKLTKSSFLSTLRLKKDVHKTLKSKGYI